MTKLSNGVVDAGAVQSCCMSDDGRIDLPPATIRSAQLHACISATDNNVGVQSCWPDMTATRRPRRSPVTSAGDTCHVLVLPSGPRCIAPHRARPICGEASDERVGGSRRAIVKHLDWNEEHTSAVAIACFGPSWPDLCSAENTPRRHQTQMHTHKASHRSAESV